jgi:hypothetical protein
MLLFVCCVQQLGGSRPQSSAAALGSGLANVSNVVAVSSCKVIYRLCHNPCHTVKQTEFCFLILED